MALRHFPARLILDCCGGYRPPYPPSCRFFGSNSPINALFQNFSIILPGALQSAHTSLLWTFLDISPSLLYPWQSRLFLCWCSPFPRATSAVVWCRPESPEAGDGISGNSGRHPLFLLSFALFSSWNNALSYFTTRKRRKGKMQEQRLLVLWLFQDLAGYTCLILMLN